MYTIKFP